MSSMFENQAPQATLALVEALGDQLAMLPDADQEFVLGCKLHLEVGGILTQQNHAKLHQIEKALRARDEGTEAYAAAQRCDSVTAAVASTNSALTMKRILLDLASVIGSLSTQERQFANMLAQKFRAKQLFTDEETKALLRVHARKGF